MLFAPVIRSRTAEGTPSGDQEELAGYARVIVLLEQIVEAAWEGLFDRELGGRIVDAKDPSRRIYNFSEDHTRERSAGGSWEGAVGVRIGAGSWSLPGAAWRTRNGMVDRSVLGGGLTLTLLEQLMSGRCFEGGGQTTGSEQLSTLSLHRTGSM